MPEENKKKINLSWLKLWGQENTKSEEKKDIEVLNVPEIIEEEKVEIEEEKVEIKSSKISLAWMRKKRETPKSSSKEIEPKVEDKENSEKNAPLNNNEKSENETLSLNTEKVEILLDEEKVATSWEENKKDDAESFDNKKEWIKDNWEAEKKSLFSNYTSDFEKEEGSILEKLKELWKKPQTRVLLVVILIFSTIVWISALFFIDPKRHSVSHYKAVLIGAYNKYTWKGTFTEKNNNLKVKQKIEPQWKGDSLIRNGYKINIQTKTNLQGLKLYKFNNTEFNTISKLNKEIDIEIKKLKTNKVKDFLLKAKLKKQEEATKKAPSNTQDKKQKKSTLQILQERK